VPALVFDCDGVLADTERDGHLPAFNQTFAEVGLPVRWSEADYAQKVLIGGGKERMASLLTPTFVAEAGLPTDPDEQVAMVADWHRRKTAIYTRIIAEGSVPPRPGVARLSAEADAAGWQLAVASTSAEVSVRSVLEHAVGPRLATRFAVFAGDVVRAKKPAPDIYLLALRELGVDADDAVVVEDSRNGLLAARGAGLRCVITTSSYTTDEDFTGAALVVDSLGDPPTGPDAPGVEAHVRAAAAGVQPAGFVQLADLRQILDRPAVPTLEGA
jgi:HAD superfamily hydrolase (TIGR01509 family)